MNKDYHIPVLGPESIEFLHIRPNGVYVDATFGGGGHSSLILKRLGDSGHLFGIDRDQDAHQNSFEDDRFTLIAHNYRYMNRFLRYYGVQQVDGILADLGVSSYQFDTDVRGFSHRMQGPLDMRMNQRGGRTAADVLNELPVGELQQILSDYGEVRNAKTLAERIVEKRSQYKIERVEDLTAILEQTYRGNQARYFAQVFQALRIYVNEEMDSLKEFLNQVVEVLKPGGRLVVISYHSLEDRMAKNLIKTGNVKGELIKDDYGRVKNSLRAINSKVIVPDETEINLNSRARSAKMRVAEKY
ncbi:MAG: 16S rRNA (cytosine(1402)-N(4))-methyltransferase RsmH [Saprospiraceae bacterium]